MPIAKVEFTHKVHKDHLNFILEVKRANGRSKCFRVSEESKKS